MDQETWSLDINLDRQNSRYVLGPLAGLELRRFVPHPPPLYVVDRNVARRHPRWLEDVQDCCQQCEHSVLEVPGGEQIKTLDQLDKIFSWLAERSLARDGTLVAVGGGSVLDVAGMAAATWRRGVDFVSVPTTLLAMVDASIGGKTGLNAAGLKNAVGCFHPAAGILADACFLSSLSRRDWRNGMAEAIKTAAIGDAELFAAMHAHREVLSEHLGTGEPDEMVPGLLAALPWRNWIARCATVKARVVTRDFRESGPRRALNLGHTLGHVLEAWTLAGNRPLSHGEAVAVGMAVVFRIAAERGTCPLPAAVQMIELLKACGLPVRYPAPPAEDIDRLLAGDKKQSARTGLKWVLPERIGRMDIDAAVSTSELLRWLD